MLNLDDLPPLSDADARRLAFDTILDLTDDPVLIQAVAAYGAAVRADERERCAALADAQYRNAVQATQGYGEWARCAEAIARAIRAKE